MNSSSNTKQLLLNILRTRVINAVVTYRAVVKYVYNLRELIHAMRHHQESLQNELLLGRYLRTLNVPAYEAKIAYYDDEIWQLEKKRLLLKVQVVKDWSKVIVLKIRLAIAERTPVGS